MNNIVFQFTILELLSFLGLVQSVYVLVYIAFRPGHFFASILPILFFILLSFAFLLGVAESRWQDDVAVFPDVKWFLWTAISPLSMLLILKAMRMAQEPPKIFWIVLFFLPVAYLNIQFWAKNYGDSGGWYHVHAIIIGALSLLIIWIKREWLDLLRKRKKGQERYWLVLCLIILNLGLLLVNFGFLHHKIPYDTLEMVKTLIGISFVYIASTSLFRVFPQSIPENSIAESQPLSPKDIETALKIEDLVHLDKVYQEPNYGRSDMAKELGLSDSHLSRIVKLYFEKSVPQLLNGLRVEEAKDFLIQTGIDITTISAESGFNSIATFNRVFKEIEGVSPSEYREERSNKA